MNRTLSDVLVVGLFSVFLPYAELGSAQESAKTSVATGVVYLDANANQRFDAGDKPLADVRVSNGRDVVRTSAEGKYELTVDDDDILFVVKPKGYRTLLSEDNLPRFYYIHKPAGSPNLKFKGVAPTGELPASVDFPLYEQNEPEQFRARERWDRYSTARNDHGRGLAPLPGRGARDGRLPEPLLDDAPDEVAHSDTTERRTSLEGPIEVVREIDCSPHGNIFA